MLSLNSRIEGVRIRRATEGAGGGITYRGTDTLWTLPHDSQADK